MYDQLSALRNLGFYGEMYEVADIPGQVERYLRMLGLWDRRFEPVATFSKGMRSSTGTKNPSTASFSASARGRPRLIR